MGFCCWLSDDVGVLWSDLLTEPRLGDARCFPKASNCSQGSILMLGAWPVRTNCSYSERTVITTKVPFAGL